MIVIIDGYNLLKQVFYKIKGKLDKQREQLVMELGFYKSKKSPEIKEIVVVFDGGLLRHADRQTHNGIVVVFSGQRQSADDYILDFVERNKNKEILLVSKDNELKKRCSKFNVDAVDVFDFYDIVKNTILNEVESEFQRGAVDSIHKYERNGCQSEQLRGFSGKNSEALDILMSQGSLDIKKDESEIKIVQHKKNKKSKLEKRIYKKIKKL